MIVPHVYTSTLDDQHSLWAIFFDGDGHVHDDDKENFSIGLPQRVKDKAMSILKVHPRIKPSALGNQVRIVRHTI